VFRRDSQAPGRALSIRNRVGSRASMSESDRLALVDCDIQFFSSSASLRAFSMSSKLRMLRERISAPSKQAGSKTTVSATA
jgi:hypothetical protein